MFDLYASISRSEVLAWDWSDVPFDPWTDTYLTNRRLNLLHWTANARPSHAPSLSELREMILTRIHDKLLRDGKNGLREAGITRTTIAKLENGVMPASYAWLADTCKRAGIEVTLTPPGKPFSGALGTETEPPDPLTTPPEPSDAPKPAPEAAESLAPAPEPPSPKEVVDAVADRLEELSGTGVTPTQITTHREDVTEEKLKRLRRGMLPPYDELRTLLAAIEMDLVIKPVGSPIPKALEHARFTSETLLPVVQITPHDSGTTVSGEPITRLPAPWDLADKDACYVICPDDRMDPTGMNAGEYCLVGQGAKSALPHLPVYLELTNCTRMLGLMDNVPDRGGKPITFMQWGTPENDYKLTLTEIPNGDIARELRVLAIYDGRPSIHRTPRRRMIDPN